MSEKKAIASIGSVCPVCRGAMKPPVYNGFIQDYVCERCSVSESLQHISMSKEERDAVVCVLMKHGVIKEGE